MDIEQPIRQALDEQRQLLTEVESKALIRLAGVATTDTLLTTSPEEAAQIASEIGFPVALKVVSPQVVHKSDSGGVRLDLRNEAQVADAYRDIVKVVGRAHPDATIEGVSVQAMVTEGIEVLVGGAHDPQFGPVIAFGIGGIWVEVLKDVTFRVLPIQRSDAAEMIREIQGFALLAGVRGQPGADLDALEEVILAVAGLLERYPEIESLDLNPVMACPKGAIAVDARVLLHAQGHPEALVSSPSRAH